MTALLPRLACASTAFLLVAVTGHHALAEFPANGTISIEVQLPNSNHDGFAATDDATIQDYFNLAHCECSLTLANPTPGVDETHFALELQLQDVNPIDVDGMDAQVYVGQTCDDIEYRDRCELVDTIPDLSELDVPTTYPILLHKFMFPTEGMCLQNDSKNTVYLLDPEGSQGTENIASVEIAFDTEPPPLPQDRQLKPGENAVTISWAAAAENQGDVSYYQVLCATSDGAPAFAGTGIEARYDTAETVCPAALAGLRRSGARQPVSALEHDGGVHDADVPDADPGAPDAGTEPDAGTAPGLPAVFDGLPESLLCGEVAGTSTEIRIGGLQNGIEYQFVLLVVDEARNVTYHYLGTEKPAAAVDFWEDYHNQGGNAEGGICLATSTFGDHSGPTQALRDFRDDTLATFALGRALIDVYYEYVAPLGIHAERSIAWRALAVVVLAPAVGVAAFWEYTDPFIKLLSLCMLIWLLQRRMSRKLRTAQAGPQPGPRRWSMALAASTCALALLGWAASASAQSGVDPYMEEFAPVEESVAVARSRWNAGIKLGPYVPGVDSEFDVQEGESGPYERMFGGSAIMGVIEVERFFLWPAGQLGVTASLGFMTKSASAWATDEDGMTVPTDPDGNPLRSEGDTTSFRMLPSSLGVVYRLTALDDLLRIPVVPYGKAGLSYYLWWINAPSGNVAQVPTDACPDPADPAAGCDGNRALGASLGWQASLGLALRAERVDKEAAMSLRNEYGIEHAGIYAELTYAKVDGFGSDSKLTVGDMTWFAGMNFEF